MKAGIRYAVLSSAVAATLYGPAAVHARDLFWDATGVSAPTGADGSGDWNTTNTNWVDPVTGLNVSFSNAIPDSARFGTTAAATGTASPFSILLTENITVLNLTLSTASTGAAYNIFDQGDGLQTLTIAGNIVKAGVRGAPQFFLTNAINLTAGNHIIAAGDSPGDTIPELTFNSALTGSGSITIDNTYQFAGAAADIQYGTTAFNVDNTYTGGTAITSGRLVANTSGALGTGGVEVSSAGALSFGGAGTTNGNLTINNAITISRTDYTTADTNNRYNAAVIASNDGSSNTITLNNVIVNSTDARVQANTNRIIIPNALTAGAIGAATAVFTADGDFAGFIQLGGDNTAYGTAGGTIKIQGGVEVEASSEANLGGATSKLLLAGGSIRPTGTLGASGSPFMTNFGGHNLGAQPVNTGLNLDNTQTFTVNNLSGTAVGTRGQGTINFNGTNVFTGVPFFDGGIANVNGTTSLGAFRLRNSTLNINNGATLNTTGSFTDIGVDNTETGTVNVLSGGKLAAASFDFNISDNAGSTGVLNVQNGGAVTIAGDTYLGKNANTSGTVNLAGNATFTVGTPTAFRALRIGNGNATAKGFMNVADTATLTANGELYVGRAGGTGVLTQSSGTINANQGGGNSFVLGGDNGSTGTFTKTGGATNIAGETWIGNAGAGKGTMTMTAGTVVANNWFVVGRGGAFGTLDVSGGTITRQNNGGSHNYVGESAGQLSTMTVRGTGSVTFNAGQFWLGNGGSSKGVLNVQDTGSVQVTNNWLAVGRNGTAQGFLNISGGTLTKTGSYVLATNAGSAFTIGSGGTAVGTVTQTGGAITSEGTFVGENGTGSYTTSAGTGTFTNAFSVGTSGTGNGTFTLGGTAAISTQTITVGNANTSNGTVNLNGGTLSTDAIVGGASTGTRTLNLNGTQINANATTANFIGGLSTAKVQAGGAKISTAGFNATVGQALVHDSALAATPDGGLTKSGLGTLTLNGANTYTGATVITGGTVQANAAAYNIILNGAGGVDIQSNKLLLDYSATTSPVAQVKTILDGEYANGFQSGQIRSSTALPTGKVIGYGDDGLTTVTIRYTLAGDATLNGTVDFNDFLILQNNFGVAGTRFDQGNFNYDGLTDFNDFLALQNNFGQSVTGVPVSITQSQVAALTAFANSSANLVPEPASLAVLAGIGAALTGRRRRSVSRA